MIINVKYISKVMAEELKPSNKTLLISISDPDELVSIDWDKWKHHLIIKCNDIAVPIEGYTLFNKDHANQIISAIGNLDEEVTTVVVHCNAGVSRSGAVALFLHHYLLEDNISESYFSGYNKYIYRTLVEQLEGKINE